MNNVHFCLVHWNKHFEDASSSAWAWVASRLACYETNISPTAAKTPSKISIPNRTDTFWWILFYFRHYFRLCSIPGNHKSAWCKESFGSDDALFLISVICFCRAVKSHVFLQHPQQQTPLFFVTQSMLQPPNIKLVQHFIFNCIVYYFNDNKWINKLNK